MESIKKGIYMQVTVNRKECGRFESYLVKITDITEWTKLMMGISIMVKEQKNESNLIRNRLADPKQETYDFHEIAKELKNSEYQLKVLEEMLYAFSDTEGRC